MLTNVSLEHRAGVLAILGAAKDGTSLLLDLLDGSAPAAMGRVSVLGTTPAAARSRVSRVRLDAPLPEALRVGEVCDLAGKLRGDAPAPARERLGALGLGALAERSVRSLAVEERRAVALAIAVTSARSEVLLVDEPLAALDPVAPRLVVEALRRRAESASVIVTTASARDAVRLADRLGVLTAGTFTPLPSGSELTALGLGPYGIASVRIVVSASSGKAGAAALTGTLGADPAVDRVEAAAYGTAPERAHAVIAAGRDQAALARAVTRAIATAGVDVDLVESSTPSLEAIRVALAAREASPPPGSLPPRPPEPAVGGTPS